MAASLMPISDDHQTQADQQAIAAPGLSETVHKVDRAVARLEELQCLMRASHTNNAHTTINSRIRREKLALHASDTCKALPYRHTANGPQHACHRWPITSTDANQGPQQSRAQSSKPALPVTASRRSARVAALPPCSSHKRVCSSLHAPATSNAPGKNFSPPAIDMSQPSPPSACSSSVPAFTRRASLKKDVGPSKLPRTFVVDVGLANPNRPWCFSASPSPACTSSTTSNYIYTPSSNSSSTALPFKSPSRFSPLYRQSSRSGKDRDIFQSQPLLCKSPEHLVIKNPKRGSPSRPRKGPWFSQTRLSLPTINASAANAKKAPRRFSLAARTYQDSPPRPLPALITRLPMRRKTASSPREKVSAAIGRRRSFSVSQSIWQPMADLGPKTGTIEGEDPLQKPTAPLILPPLPLPPSLQGQVASMAGLPPASISDGKGMVMHKRSTSCPRQCLLPVSEGNPNTLSPVVSSSQLPTKQKVTTKACFPSHNKENCFPGCSPAAWPCMRRSWSFSQQTSLVENLTGAGPYIVKQVKGYMQHHEHAKNMESHVYKVDSFERQSDAFGSKLYMG